MLPDPEWSQHGLTGDAQCTSTAESPSVPLCFHSDRHFTLQVMLSSRGHTKQQRPGAADTQEGTELSITEHRVHHPKHLPEQITLNGR